MTETHTARVHTEPVVLDVGPDRGGLVIYTPPDFCGKEYEISPKGAESQRVHTDVAERRVGGRSIFAAVYLPMPPGEYTIWGPDPAHPTTVIVVAGAVAEIDWR